VLAVLEPVQFQQLPGRLPGVVLFIKRHEHAEIARQLPQPAEQLV
jgi:hypothetical protein